MAQGIKLLVYPVKDVARSQALFAALLGVEPYANSAHYVGFRVGDQEIGLVPDGHRRGMPGPIAYCSTTDIRKGLQALLEAGGELQQDVKNVGGGLLTATVKDTSGNVVGLSQAP